MRQPLGMQRHRHRKRARKKYYPSSDFSKCGDCSFGKEDVATPAKYAEFDGYVLRNAPIHIR